MAALTPLKPKLTADLKQQLALVEPSRNNSLEYYPCSVELLDGNRLDCVYLVSEIPFLKAWRIYPHEDRGKRSLDLQRVRSISESDSRLPAVLATKLYRIGESGMGYYVFTVVFNNGKQQAYSTGNAVDFIRYPEGLHKEDVVDVIPNSGRYDHVEGADYYWCLFSE